MAKNKKPEMPPKGSPAWMASYADLITVMLVFFVLLFSMSSIDASKFLAMVQSMSNNQTLISTGSNDSVMDLVGSGIMEMPNVIRSESTIEQAKKAQEEMKQMVSDFKTYFAENMLQDSIEIGESEYSITLNFTEGILFDSARADLKPESRDILNVVANELLKYPGNSIVITGHTDTAPINTIQFPSNHVLSAVRAISVFKYFMDENGIDPNRMEYGGRGELEPILPNDSPENMARNRRVEIKIMSQFISNEI